MNIHRFLSTPGSVTNSLITKAGQVLKDGLVELTDEETERLSGQYGLEPVDEADLSDAEKESVVRLPKEEVEPLEVAPLRVAPTQQSQPANPAGPVTPGGDH